MLKIHRSGRASLVDTDVQAKSSSAHICMHVVGSVATDERVLREASALQLAGYRVSIIDIGYLSFNPKRFNPKQ